MEGWGADMPFGVAYRVWWAAGAIFITLLVVDVFALLASGLAFGDHLVWFFLGLLTAVFLAASVVLAPRRSA